MGWFGELIGGAADFIGGAFRSVGSFLSEGLSMVMDTVSDIAATIGDGIKSLCESLGSETIALIGCIAIAILVPGVGVPEILALIQTIAQVAKILGVNEGEDTPEELGMKMGLSDKKPEDFDSIEDYIKHLNENVDLEEGAIEKLDDEEKAKYGAMGAALNIMAIQEKYGVTLSAEFVQDVNRIKLSSEEIAEYIKTFKENGITKMQDMSSYLKDQPLENEKANVASAMMQATKEVYPELNENELAMKIYEMKEQCSVGQGV